MLKVTFWKNILVRIIYIMLTSYVYNLYNYEHKNLHIL